jgi:hypothetical protein
MQIKQGQEGIEDEWSHSSTDSQIWQYVGEFSGTSHGRFTPGEIAAFSFWIEDNLAKKFLNVLKKS